jgi:hypothetical protein
MNNLYNNTNTIKRSGGRPGKNSTNKNPNNVDTSIHSVIIDPNIDDIYDELVRMDSFTYSRYKEQEQ